MAKHGKARRKMGKYIRGNVDEQLQLTTLAAKTLVGVLMDETVNERTFVSSMLADWSIRNVTTGTGIGPVMVGVAHGDYSDAEIEEWIETVGSWNEGDMVQSREVGRRLIRRIGTFTTNIQSAVADSWNLQDKPIKTKLGWILIQGQTLRVWAYNLGGSPFASTVPEVMVQGHVNLWPR